MAFFQETISLSRDENIVGTFRSHPITAVLTILPFGIILILVCLFVFPLISLGVKGVAFFVLFVLLDMLFIFTVLSQWIGTIAIVTSRRIIKIDRRSMFKKCVNEYQLETITEIAYDSKGILQTFFSLGNINITALYTGTRYTIIKHVWKPQHVLDIISHAISRVQKKQEKSNTSTNNLHEVEVSGDEGGEESNND